MGFRVQVIATCTDPAAINENVLTFQKWLASILYVLRCEVLLRGFSKEKKNISHILMFSNKFQFSRCKVRKKKSKETFYLFSIIGKISFDNWKGMKCIFNGQNKNSAAATNFWVVCPLSV